MLEIENHVFLVGRPSQRLLELVLLRIHVDRINGLDARLGGEDVFPIRPEHRFVDFIRGAEKGKGAIAFEQEPLQVFRGVLVPLPGEGVRDGSGPQDLRAGRHAPEIAQFPVHARQLLGQDLGHAVQEEGVRKVVGHRCGERVDVLIGPDLLYEHQVRAQPTASR